MNNKSILKEELSIFRKVNGANKIVDSGHQNLMMSNDVTDVLKNQGISRGKLREFVKKENMTYDSWKNV